MKTTPTSAVVRKTCAAGLAVALGVLTTGGTAHATDVPLHVDPQYGAGVMHAPTRFPAPDGCGGDLRLDLGKISVEVAPGVWQPDAWANADLDNPTAGCHLSITMTYMDGTPMSAGPTADHDLIPTGVLSTTTGLLPTTSWLYTTGEMHADFHLTRTMGGAVTTDITYHVDL